MGDERNKQQDIRKWINSPSSSGGTPARRRRVMSTSDSEAERDQTPHRPLPLQPSQAQTAALDGDQLASERDDAGTGAPDAPEIVALSSSSEDSMYIPRRQASGGANEPARQTIRAGTTRSRRNSQPGAGATGRTSVGKKRSKKTEPKFCGEASESSTTDKPSSDCSESDADAQCLYNAAPGSCSPLADLIHFDDLWEMVCSNLSGDALCCVEKVHKFSSATRNTPAFILLAGINNDAQLVPWFDATNVLSTNFNSFCSLCNRSNCQHFGHDWDREIAVIKTAQSLLWNAEYPLYLRNQEKPYPSIFQQKGPARPPSPFDGSVASYVPQNANGIPGFLQPPVFGIRPGFSYAPFWSVLVGNGDCYSDDDQSD